MAITTTRLRKQAASARRMEKLYRSKGATNAADELGLQAAGYTVGDKVGGTFGNILGRLRSLGLIDYPGPGNVVALPVLFLEGR